MHDDTSQRSHRLAVTQPVHPTATTTRSPRTAVNCLLTCLPQVCHGKRHGFERMQLTRGDTTQHCHRLAPLSAAGYNYGATLGFAPAGLTPASSASLPPCPPPTFQTEKQLTAPADRPLRAPAHAVAFSTGVAAGYDRNAPGSPPPNSPSQNRPPTSPVSHFRCSADHRPAWRCDAGPDVRRAVGVCMMGRARGSHLTSGIWQGTLCPKSWSRDDHR